MEASDDDGKLNRESGKFLRFNISGQKFLVCDDLFRSDAGCLFLSEEFLARHWTASLNAFYFNRDAALFGSVLNWFRYRKLIVPPGMDDEMVEDELRFWNIRAESHQSKEDKRMEKEFFWVEGRYPPLPEGASGCARRRFAAWSFLTDPVGPHTRFKMAAVTYAAFSILATCLYLVLYGLTTSQEFRVLSRRDINLSADTCGSRSECFASTQPLFWLTTCLRALSVLFIIETISKLICCPDYSLYFKSVINWFDLLANTLNVVATALEQQLPSNYVYAKVVLQGLQILRIFRVFQYASLLDGLLVMLLTLKASFKELSVLFTYLMMGMLFFSTLVTLVEFTASEGITDCLIGYWWAIITMTTVGYGDVSPGSTLGYVVGIACALTGLILTSLPVAVIGNNFTIYWEFNQKRKKSRATSGVASEETQSADKVGSRNTTTQAWM